jgi:hypothetical protein
MRMKSHDLVVTVDLVGHVVEVGELAKLGSVLGYRVVIEPGDERNQEDPRRNVVRFIRDREVFGETEVADLAAVLAVVNQWSGQQVLDTLKRRFEEMQLPLDKPIEDVMSIGQGPDVDSRED